MTTARTPRRTLDPIDPDKPYGRADLRVQFALLLDRADACGGQSRTDVYRILGEMVASLTETLDEMAQSGSNMGDAGSQPSGNPAIRQPSATT